MRIAKATREPKPAGIGAKPPAPPFCELGVGDRRAATLSDGLPDVPASRRAVFRVDRRPANPTLAPTEFTLFGLILL
jgi:hypothetical protein